MEEVEEDQIINQNNVFTVTEQIIQWMSATLNMGILHGTSKRMNSSTCNLNVKIDSLQNNNQEESVRNSLTNDQVQRLIQLLESSTIHGINQIQRHNNETARTKISTKGKNPWILNTSATNHVTYLKNQFTILYKIKPINIKLLNGSLISAPYFETIQIFEQFIIFNFLYVPKFSFNIIFVLTKDLNCKLIYSL